MRQRLLQVLGASSGSGSGGGSGRDDDRHVQFGADAAGAGHEVPPSDDVGSDTIDDADDERRTQRNA